MNTTTQQLELSANQIEILLKEYEICITDAHELEQFMWTTASILVPASIAGIVYLSTDLKNIGIYEFLVQTGVSIFAIVFIWQWSNMVKRWYSYQTVTYYRASEIERTLGMYKGRYEDAVKDAADKGEYEQDPLIIKAVELMLPQFHRVSVRKTVSRIGPILIIAWIFWLIIQTAAVLQLF